MWGWGAGITLAGVGDTAATPPAAGAAAAAAAGAAAGTAAGAAAGAAAHVPAFPPAAFPLPAPPAPPAPPPLLAPPLARRFPWPRPIVLGTVSGVLAVAGVVVVLAVVVVAGVVVVVAVVVVDVVVVSLDWTGFVLLSGLLCDGSGLKNTKINPKNHNNFGNTYQGENLLEEKRKMKRRESISKQLTNP